MLSMVYTISDMSYKMTGITIVIECLLVKMLKTNEMSCMSLEETVLRQTD